MFVSAEGETGVNAAGSMGAFTSLLLPVGLLVVMYFFLIRPQKKQEKEISAMRRNLVVGDEISTNGGLLGRIVKINDETDVITIETGSDKTKLKIFRWAVRKVEVPFEDKNSGNE
ncbi:MAG: preprotein translocase subunit YajC [Clostridia bacterium]|nr:preprotein translocase subunit YajC [Clostridia bacterium]